MSPSTPPGVCGGYYGLRHAHFHLRSDVFVLVLAESVVQLHVEALLLLYSDFVVWEAWDLKVRGDYGYIFPPDAPAIEGEPAKRVVVVVEKRA